MSKAGENIRYYRKLRGLTLRELSSMTEVPVVTIQQYETGNRREPRKSVMDKLAKALNVSVDQLYGDIADVTVENKSYRLIADLIPIEQYERIAKFVAELEVRPQSKEVSSNMEKEILDEYKELIKVITDLCIPGIKEIYIDSIPDRIKYMKEFIRANSDLMKSKMPGELGQKNN